MIKLLVLSTILVTGMISKSFAGASDFDGFYVGGYRCVPFRWEPTAAMVKAVLLTSGQHVGIAMFRDGSTKLIPENVPNFDIGFGLINLQRTLFLHTAPVRQAECACISVPMSGEEEHSLLAQWHALLTYVMNSSKDISPSPSKSISLIIRAKSSSFAGCPKLFSTEPSSAVDTAGQVCAGTQEGSKL